MDEAWVDAPGLEGVIKVSNCGGTRSFLRNKVNGIPVKASLDTAGYPTLRLTLNGVKRNYLVHRLVATAFIPNPERKREVNHIDGNKANNNVANLEWATHKENLMHAARTGLMDGVAKASSERNRKGVAAISENGDVLDFDSLNAAAAYFGRTNTSNISAVLHGRRKRCAGHVFVWTGGDNECSAT